MKLISAVILVVLAVIGAAGVIRMITQKLFGGFLSDRIVWILPMKADSGSAEQMLRGAAEKLSEAPFRGVKAVCLDCGMDAETREICARFCRGYPCFEVMTPDELAAHFKT